MSVFCVTERSQLDECVSILRLCVTTDAKPSMGASGRGIFTLIRKCRIVRIVRSVGDVDVDSVWLYSRSIRWCST